MRPLVPIALLALASGLLSLPARADEPPAPAPPSAPDTGKPDTGKPAPDAAPKRVVDPVKAAAEAARAAEAVKAAAARRAALIKQGTELCNTGEIEEGLSDLEAAWSQKEEVDLAIALASCEVKAERWPGAADHLAYALRVVRDPEQRKGLEPTFVNVRARVGGVKVTVSLDGADVFVGDRYAGQSPLAAEVYVMPGRARVSAKKPGYAEVEDVVQVQANGTAEVSLDFAGENLAAKSRPVPLAPRSRTPAFVLGGITLLVGGVGAALVAAGASKGSAADSLLGELQTTDGSFPCPKAPGCLTLKGMRSDHDAFVNAGVGVLGVGGALLGATIIYSLWATRAPSRAGLTFAPVASASGGGLVTHGTF